MELPLKRQAAIRLVSLYVIRMCICVFVDRCMVKVLFGQWQTLRCEKPSHILTDL